MVTLLVLAALWIVAALATGLGVGRMIARADETVSPPRGRATAAG